MDCFCFVILHYETKEDTIECINSLLSNLSYPNIRIIVVDNGSVNKSGAVLLQLYRNNEKIKIISNSRNLGFTDGNNVGFRYAKYQLDADYIALINNDTIVHQNNFVEAVIEKNKEIPFHILGPDIVTVKGVHQNPVFNKLSSLKAVENYIRHYRKVLALNYLGLDKILEKLKKTFFPKSNIHIEEIKKDLDYSTEQKGVTLHGSAMIFSGSYIRHYDGLTPGPFMYGEESILDFIVKRDNLVSIYSPEIRILHKDDSTTNFIYKKSLLKRRFYLKNFLNSLTILHNLMKER